MTKNVMTGNCLCDSVRFQFELPSLFAGHCHCSMCRRAHGAGYVTWVGVREEHRSTSSRNKELEAREKELVRVQGQRAQLTRARTVIV